MNKFKKLIAMVVSLVIVCAFATSAFATDYSKAREDLKGYLNGYNVNAASVIDNLTEEQIDSIKAQQDSLKSLASSTFNGVSTDPANAQKYVDTAVATLNGSIPGLSVSGAKVVPNGTTVTVTADVSVNGKTLKADGAYTAPAETKKTTDEHPEIAEAIANGTWGVASNGTAANPVTASASAVIKATGDNSAAVIFAAVLAITGVLGLAIRKERASAQA